ncbi:hypothetical protein [Actinoplanes sp. ATCC 53533]|uniref:hypothetical protein n=1 Tax=Actinoplanes sp. ATCC 53533 TaxID=1288362 RepID=UPI000F7B694E|nr:hypothetical protein [Actinoplanes sp. ATCC 53533]
MNGLFDTSEEVVLVAAASLALITALFIAWRMSGLRTEDQSTYDADIPDGNEPELLTGLEDHLAREFLGAARTAGQISPNSLAAERTPYLAERVTAAAHSVTRQLLILRSEVKDKWMTSACVGQARLVGVSVVQVETAALAAVRSPADRQVAAQLACALADLDEAVDNLHALVRSSTRGKQG